MYIKVVFAIATLICSAHVLFQTFSLINKPSTPRNSTTTSEKAQNALYDDCSQTTRILRIFGLHNLTHLTVLDIIRYFISDFIILIVTLIFFIITQRIYDSSTQRLDERLVNNDEIENSNAQLPGESFTTQEAHGEFNNQFKFPNDLNNSKTIQNKVKLWKFDQVTKYFFEIFYLVLLGSCAILNPSLLSFSYFFILLFILTWFGFNKQFTIFYVYLRIIVCLLTVGHLLLLFTYQFNEVNRVIVSEEFLPRLFGLTQYADINCQPFFNEKLRVLNWNVYIHPILLCILYLHSIYMIKHHFKSDKQKVIILIN